MRKTIAIVIVLAFMVFVQITQAMSIKQAKSIARKVILQKYGKIIEEVRTEFDSIAGLKRTTPQEVWKIRYEALVSRIKEAGSCNILLNAAGVGAVKSLSEILDMRYGSLRNILLSIGTKTTQLQISPNWSSIIYEGSKNIFLIKEKYGAKAVADMWVSIVPNLSIIISPDQRDCSDIAMAFIDQAVYNLLHRQYMRASLCILQCFSSENLNFCMQCIRR